MSKYAYTFFKICNSNKLYSKFVGKFEPISLTDALGAQKGLQIKPIAESFVDPSNHSMLTSTVKPRREISMAREKSSFESKKALKKVDPKTKRGKKCGASKIKQPRDPGPPGESELYDMPRTNAKKWKTFSYILIPFAFGLSALILATKEEAPKPDYIPYEYMYRRTKRFPWGDGKTSLFHGPNNLIPEEEEARLDREGKGKSVLGENNTVRYKKHVNEEEQKIKRREQRAKEELERRRKRHESQ